MGEDRIFSDERRYEILQRVRAEGRIQVSDLTDTYQVSAETIRKDLSALQESGFVHRTHGGAVPVERSVTEIGVHQRTTFSEEKRAIATAALTHVPETGSIFIESGSTSLLLAEMLPHIESELTVFTNSIPAALFLAEHSTHSVITLGGRVRPLTLGEVDNFAIRSLKEIHVSTAFLGTNGVSATKGLTTPDQAEAEIKRSTLRIADQKVLLADRSKIGTVATWRYGSISDIDLLITGSGTHDEDLTPIRDAGVKINTI